MKCLICNQKSSYLDDYRFNVKSDKGYFGNNSIYRCDVCNFSFMHPMPDKSKLDEYYQKIYRAPGRPHENNLNNIKKNYNNYENFDRIKYLKRFINLKKIDSVFDFGSGTGCFGYLIKKIYNQIRLFSAENDDFSKKILCERDYHNFENINELKEKFDLIISLHAIEHLTDLSILNNFKNLIKENTYIYLEVPNCEFKSSFKLRPYDSPHLMFFTKKSFERIAERYSFEIVDISYCSISIEKNFQLMAQSKKKYENWKKNKLKDYFKSTVRKFLQNYGFFNLNQKNKEISYHPDDINLSNLRVLFKNK